MSRRALFDRREVLVGGALATLAAAEAAARPIGAHGIAALSQGVPAGYTVGLINGVPASFNGRPVFAKPNGSSLIYL